MVSSLTLYSSSSSRSSSSGSPSSPPRRISSFDELYKVTTPIDNDVTLFSPCFMWFYSVWRNNKRCKMENWYGWRDCINQEEWQIEIGS
jgi:hypothetical protein